MDYDDDGILDFISGSYDPGDIYLFRGLGDGAYAAVEQILDKSGQPVVHHPKEFAKHAKLAADPDADETEKTLARVASFGSWVAPVDWEADGDLDLLIGSFGGELFRRVNEGTRSQPVYGTESIPVEADGKPINVHEHANPVVADWNADGLWDLIVSAGDGSVGWFENVGSPNEPRFGPRQALVAAAATSIFSEQHLTPGQAPVPGARAQICVTDYNGDGRLDLIVGDYSDIHWLRELSPNEKDELDSLIAQQAELLVEISKIRDAWTDGSTNESPTEEQEKQYQAVGEKYGELSEEKSQYILETRSASFVWLYLRGKTDYPAARDTTNSLAGESRATDGSEEQETITDSENGASSGPVSFEAKIEPSPSAGQNRFKLSVQMQIEPGWHTYAATPDGSSSPAFEIKLDLPDGIRAVGDWHQPKGKPYIKDLKMKIYTDTVTFTRDLEATSDEPDRSIRLDIHYQVCTDKSCLPPTTITRTVALPSAE